MVETKDITSPADADVERWQHGTLEAALHKHPERKENFQTVSLEDVNRLYTPADISNLNFSQDISFPGEFPYTRGIHPTGYRGKLWTMRQFAGFSTPEEISVSRGSDRTFSRLRFADPHGLRCGFFASGRRSRQVWSSDFFTG